MFKDFQFDSTIQKVLTGFCGSISLGGGVLIFKDYTIPSIVCIALGFCMIYALRRPVKPKEKTILYSVLKPYKKEEKHNE